jgi:hypothetical protein
MFDGGTWVDHVEAVPVDQASPSPPAAWFHLGELCLQLASEPVSFLDAFRAQWADCVVPAPLAGLRAIRCRAREVAGTSLLVLSFEGSDLPDPLDASATPMRMMRRHMRYTEQSGPAPGWRMLADRDDPGRVLAAGRDGCLVIDVEEAPAEFAIHAVIAVAQGAQPGVLFLHAASFAIGGAGAVLIGFSESGKSTTAVALGVRGHVIYGDDMAAIRARSGELLPFRRTFRLRPGPAEPSLGARLRTVPHAFTTDPGGAPRTLVRAGTLFTARPAEAIPLRFAIVLDGFSDQPRLSAFRPDIGSLEALKGCVCGSVPGWGRSAGRDLMKFLTVVDVLSKLSCHRLRLGTPEASAAAIESLMLEAPCSST